jgi:hypothetical protein
MSNEEQNVDIPAEDMWRLFPHTYAEHCWVDEAWIPYDYLKLVSFKITEMIARGGGKLIVEMPPRHGKSELISHWVPTWFLDLYPHKRVILATYEAGFSATWGRKVRNEIQYNPNVSVELAADSTSASRWNTTAGGGMVTAGIGGPITGKGGHLCLHGNTKVLTQSGYRDIKSLKLNDLVWSYNHEEERLELKRITNMASKYVSRTFEIRTHCGNRIISTPDHRFWTCGRGYLEPNALKTSADLVTAGISTNQNSLFCSKMLFLRRNFQKNKVRLRKIIQQRLQRVLLWKQMFKTTSQLQESSKMSYMWRSNRKEDSQILHNLQRKSCQTDPKQSSVQEEVHCNKAFDRIKRWLQMPFMRNKEIKNRSSYRWFKKQHRSIKSDNSMQELSQRTPHEGRDFIKSINEDSETKIEVHDITVEGNNNFFAERILVHNCIIDDPVKNWLEATSPTYQKRNIDWMKSTMRTRAEPGCVIVILQTRWHENDLAGQLQAGDYGYEVIRIPALAEENDPLGREEDEPLCPDRYSKEDLLQTKHELGSQIWAAMYQQRPSPQEGDIFKRIWWRFYDELPDGITKKIQSWDPSRKEKKNSAYCVGQVWGVKGANFYLVDQFREKMGYRKSKKAVKRMNEKWPECDEKLMEDAANGTPLLDDLKEEIPGMIGIQPKG